MLRNHVLEGQFVCLISGRHPGILCLCINLSHFLNRPKNQSDCFINDHGAGLIAAVKTLDAFRPPKRVHRFCPRLLKSNFDSSLLVIAGYTPLMNSYC